MQELIFNYIGKYINLNEAEKEAITGLNIFRTVRKGTILLKEGQVSTDEYFVLKGCLRDYYVLDGVEKTTAFYTEMDLVSPNCVANQKPSKYYIVALEDSIITSSNAGMEQEIMEQFPKFEVMCRMVSEEKAGNLKNDLDEFKTASPEQRYLNLIESKSDLVNRVPQHQLASYLGITPQSLSRIRGRLVSKKFSA